jgi:hypothetical protein
MVAEPADTPVTLPLAETLATPAALDAQVTVRPVNTLPNASFVVAPSCTVPPTKMLGAAGLTVTEATGMAGTVIAAVPFCPSLLAVIVADPAAPPVTKPFPFTEATAALLVAQVTVRPDSALPLASFGVAVSWKVWPPGTLAEVGLTATDATGTTVTVIDALPFCPSLEAVTVATPVASPLTSPPPFTEATPGLVDAHVTVRPLNGLPPESCVVAASCRVLPTAILAAVGFITNVATGAWVTVTIPVSAYPPGLPLTTTLTWPVSAPAR